MKINKVYFDLKWAYLGSNVLLTFYKVPRDSNHLIMVMIDVKPSRFAQKGCEKPNQHTPSSILLPVSPLLYLYGVT